MLSKNPHFNCEFCNAKLSFVCTIGATSLAKPHRCDFSRTSFREANTVVFSHINGENNLKISLESLLKNPPLMSFADISSHLSSVFRKSSFIAATDEVP